MQHVAFSAWLLSLSVMFLRFNRVVVVVVVCVCVRIYTLTIHLLYISASFLFVNEHYSIVSICHNFFI